MLASGELPSVKAMTVSVIVAGLLPIMWSAGTSSEVMQRIAAPMIGGMITAPLLSMLVIPVAVWLLRKPGVSPGRFSALAVSSAGFAAT